jgi:DNA-directed RNA polymerase specialized sigma subunit
MQVVSEKKERSKQIKRIEKHLRQYTTYKIGLKTLKKQLDYIMPKVVANYEYIGGSSGTFSVSSSTEKAAIDKIESKKALIIQDDIQRYKFILESIDEALKDLKELERRFVELRYFDRKTVAETSIELGYSEKHIFNLRQQVMEKLLISLKGLTQI